MMRVGLDRIAVVGVHMIQRALLAGGQRLGDRPLDQKIGSFQRIGLAEAAIQAGALRFEAEDREIAQAGVQRCLGIAIEITPLGPLVLGRFTFEAPRAAGDRHARMGEGIALSRLADQKRAARLAQQAGSMRRQPRHENERHAVEIGGDADAARQRRAGRRIDNGDRAVAGGSQQRFRQPDGVRIRLAYHVLRLGQGGVSGKYDYRSILIAETPGAWQALPPPAKGNGDFSVYFGAMRIAPSRRIVSPLSIWLSTM